MPPRPPRQFLTLRFDVVPGRGTPAAAPAPQNPLPSPPPDPPSVLSTFEATTHHPAPAMLIDQLQTLCQRLSGQGWKDLLMTVAGLNIDQPNAPKLALELARTLTVDRSVPGFEDFNRSGEQGITPGVPSASLLYHALASPAVNAGTLTGYPTLADLDLVENYVFAASKATLAGFASQVGERPLGVVVFAYEYRNAPSTVHRAYADWCLSRTGVQRVGSQAAAYVPTLRAFTPWKEGDAPDVIRVLPARYAAFLAVQLKGDDDELESFGPMDSNLLARARKLNRLKARLFISPSSELDDAKLDFWVPLHKLFPGGECLADFTGGDALSLTYAANFVNAKLQRQWRYLASFGYPLDLTSHDVNAPPFLRTDSLAKRSTTASDGPCLVVPEAQPLIASVTDPDTSLPLGFPVMKDYDDFVKDEIDPESDGFFWTSFYIPTTPAGGHAAPEYVNVRGELNGATVTDLNTLPDIEDTVTAGDYSAETFSDGSADGWVSVSIPQLETEIDTDNFIAAYSLLTAPAFFPYVVQRELMEWAVEKFESPATEWPRVWNLLPVALSHDRMAPNIELDGAGFSVQDVTVSAIVSLPAYYPKPLLNPGNPPKLRSTFLPDAAAGSYAPGWETSYDVSAEGKPFLAAYGLGSPFLEDAMICSALGTFWPGPAPDTSRIFAEPPQGYRTESPLTDAEIGLGVSTPSWDGIPAPIPLSDNRFLFVDPNYVDYTRQATLKLKPFVTITSRDFVNRVLAMFNAYFAVGVDEKDLGAWDLAAMKWRVLLFKSVPILDPGFQDAIRLSGYTQVPGGPVFLFRLAHLDIINDGKLRTAAGATFSQVLGKVVAGKDYALYTFSNATLIAPTGTTTWTVRPLPKKSDFR